MRILQLSAGDDGYTIDFHPYVTVVAGLDDAQRDAVTASFQAAIRGQSGPLGGLLEAHGVVLDLDGPSLALLELDGIDVDAVVEPGDLPGAASAGLDRQLRAAERRLEALELPYREQGRVIEAATAALDAAQEALDAARADLDAASADDGDGELGRLEAVLAAAEHAVARLAQPGSVAAGELQAAERAVLELGQGDGLADADDSTASDEQRALEERRAELTSAADAGAAEAFETALASLREAEVALRASEAARDERAGREEDPDGEGDGGTDDGDDASGQVADADLDVGSRVEELRGAIALHASFDPGPVRTALDAIRLSPAAGELVPSPEALGLADRIEAAERHMADLRARSDDGPPTPAELESAAVQLEETRDAMLELERATAPPTLDADIEQLEQVHAEVVAAREKLEGRLGRARAQARYDAAVAAEETILDRLGIRSYTDLMTGGRSALQAEAEPLELRRLRRKEREADAALRSLEERSRTAQELDEARRDLQQLQGRARTMLDDRDVADHDLVRALLDLRVPARAAAPLDELLAALEGVGLPVRSVELTRDDAELLAADWLDEYFRAEERQAALEDELAALEGRSTDPDSTPLQIVPDEAPPEPESEQPREPIDLEAAERRVSDAQEAVRAAKERMIAHESAVRQLAELDVELEALEGQVAQRDRHRDAREAAERRLAEARTAATQLDEQRAAAEARVIEARAALEQRRAVPPARVDEATRRLGAAEADVSRAESALEAARDRLDVARAGYDAAVEEVAALRQALADVSDETAPVEEIEWYLLARLAAQRHVSFAGSVPILVDRALDAVDDDGLVHLLERLERMAGAVQVVHITDDERALRWATDAGEQRAAVVRPAVPSVAE